MEEVVDVSAMNETILVLTASGDVYGFGNNQYGQLGVGDTKEYTNTRRDLAEVTLTVLARICEILDCDFGDIMEYIPERRRRSYYEILLLVALLLE